MVVGAPHLNKEFTDDPVQPGGTVTLEYTISHIENAPGPASGITFTDDLTLALPGLVATGPVNNVCGGGNLTGTTNLTFAGGSLSSGTSCTFSVTLDVPANAAPGAHTNSTSNLVATVTVLGTPFPVEDNPAEDDLQIGGLTLTKEFTDDPVLPGGTVTLRFTVANIHPTLGATNIIFTDNLGQLPGATLPGLAATGPPSPDPPCGVGSSLIGTTSLIFQGGTVAAGASCTFDVTLLVPVGSAADDHGYPNTTGALIATFGGGPVFFDPATDNLLVVEDILSLVKEFTNDPVSPGESVNLRFEILNLSPSGAVTGIAFSDNLDDALTGLVATGLPSSACGGTLSGTDTISLAGGSLAAGGDCTFDVAVTVPLDAEAGVYPNTTSSLIADSGVTGDPATDDLVIDLIEFTKSFQASDAAPGSAVDLQFNIQNPGTSANNVVGLTFLDDLDAALSGLVATGLPANDVCGTGSMLDGTSELTLTGGNLLPEGSCTFSVSLQIPFSAPIGASGVCT